MRIFNPQPKPEKYRNEGYLNFIRNKPCLCCGEKSVAAHVSILMNKGTSTKVDDCHTLPLCPGKHHPMLDEYPEDFKKFYPHIDLKKEIIKNMTEWLLIKGA